MITIAITDSHAILSEGVKHLLELNENLSVINLFLNGFEMLAHFESTNNIPDIVLLDLNIPKMDGPDIMIQTLKKYPKIKVIIFSALYHEDIVKDIILKGASGYIDKSIKPSLLSEIIIEVYYNGYYANGYAKKEYFDKGLKKRNLCGFHGNRKLTIREIEFIRLASTNLGYKEMSTKLGISPKTVENYRDNLYLKLNVNNRAALVIYGIQNGLIHI